MKEDLVKEGWEFINKKSVCPASMQDIDYGFTKDFFGRSFYIKHYEDDNILVIYTYTEPNKNHRYYIDSCEIKTMEDIEKFVEKWKE